MVAFDSGYQRRSETFRQLNTRLAQLDFEGTPLQTTYYKVDNMLSSVDPNTGSTKASIGKESPYRYVRINDFILLSNDEMFNGIEQSYGEEDSNFLHAQESGMEAEFIIINTFSLIPQQNDYFTIFFEGLSTKLFRVISVSRSHINDKITAYKIKCSYTPYSLEEDPTLLSITRKVTFKYDAFNSLSNFVEDDDSEGDKYRSVRRGIFDMVTHKLREKDGEVPVSFDDSESEEFLIDPYLVEFLRNNYKHELFLYNLIGNKFKKYYANSVWAMLEFLIMNDNIPNMYSYPYCNFQKRIVRNEDSNPYYEMLKIVDVGGVVSDPFAETKKPELKPNMLNTLEGVEALLDDDDMIRAITKQVVKNKGDFYNYTEDDYKLKTNINIEVDVGKAFVDNNADIIPNITKVINSVLVQKLKKK